MSFRVDDILDKMNSRDGDFRYMAISDFMTEIQKENFKLDAESEKKIVNKLLDMVAKDGNADVKALAVKCLGPLATTAQEAQLQNMIDKLGNYLLADNMEDEIRDISSIGLKTVIAEVPDTKTETVNLIISRLAPRLVEVIGKDSKPEVVVLCLDVMNDLLSRWGKEMGKQKLYDKIQKSVLPHLQDAQSANRKKAIGCISFLSVSIPDNLFVELTEFLIKNLETSKKPDHVRTYIQATGAISRAVGFRLGKHLNRIVPILFRYCKQEDTDDEIKENCLQTFESLVLRCPKEADQYLEQIETLCQKFISYDPNYVDESEGEADAEEMEVDDGEGSEFDDSDYDFTDDDDMSWKVRKSATRCLTAIIKTRPERLNHLYQIVAPTLVKRFKEREENVKLDVFNAFVELLRQTAIVGLEKENAAGESSLASQLEAHIPSIVRALVKELKGKSLKTRPGVFQLLVELVTVLPGSLSKHVKDFLPGLESSLSDKNSSSALKIESLLFLRALLQHHKPADFHPYLKTLTPPVYKAVLDRYYKITAEGLRVSCQITRVLAEASSSFDAKPYAQELYDTTLERLKQLDIDQEVKEVAIECMGLIISLLGDKLNNGAVPAALKMLTERLGNEVTRLVTVKAFEQIAGSHLKIDIQPVLEEVVKLLATFLRQHNRQLKQATISALTVIINNYGKAHGVQYDAVLKELAEIVSEQDLHLSHLALNATASILHVDPSAAELIKSHVLPRCYALLKSALLQGLVLDSMLSLFKELVTANTKQLPFDALLTGLIQLGSTEGLSKQSYHSIAQCIAVLVANNNAGRDATVKKFVSDIVEGKTESSKLLSLYCIGEIGRRVDLSDNASVKKNILASLDSQSEEIKSAASVALGCVAVGNLSHFLPDILSEINSNEKRQYLLLGSLREVIVRLSLSTEGTQQISAFFDKLLSLLFKHTATSEEGTRNVVSECLGKLALIEPEKVITTLKKEINSQEKYTRACVTTAIKSAVIEKSHPVDHVLAEHISDFLSLLQDKEIVVRKAALLSLNYLAHHKPQIIRPLLPQYLPALYNETTVKAELIREVDVGPFKHKVDQGIELRQAAFEAMYTLLDTCLPRLDLVEFIRHLVPGLGDIYDIQMLNHLIIMRLAKKAGASLVGSLDALVEPLKVAVTTTPKDQAVQQQVERVEELIRSALRAVVAIVKILEAENSHNFQEFMRTTVSQGALKEKYDAIYKEQTDR